MKNLFLILFIFSFGIANSQAVITYTPMTAAGYQFKYLKADSGLNVPNRDTSTGRGTVRGGSLVFDSTHRLFYGWDGIRWNALGNTTSTGVFVDSITVSGNNICQWIQGVPTCYTLSGGGTFTGVDSLTYTGNSLCWWKAGVPTCYSMIPGVDSITVVGNDFCQWIAGDSTCYTINNGVLGVFVDSVTVFGTQLCQWISGVSTCYTINSTSSGVDSITVVDSILCSWSQGVSTCFNLNRRDTIYVTDDLYVIWDATGHQVIGRLHDDGLESGGIVTKYDCWQVEVSPSVFYINRTRITLPNEVLSVDTADATLPRIDIVVVDSSGAHVIAGTPSSTPVAAQIDPSYQIALTTIYIPAGATCLGIDAEVIYDGIADDAAQWNITTSGTMTVDFVNTANPLHLNQSAFFSTYTSNSYVTFTKPSGTDTVVTGMVLKLPMYLNVVPEGTPQIEFYNGTQAVSQKTSITPWFNPLDINNWQNVSIPLSQANFYSTEFNKLRITFSGNDISGAGGLYHDYIQLQKGLTPQGKTYVDSVNRVGDSVYYYKNGVPTYVTNIPVSPAQFNPIAGTNVTITGTYPNMTFNATAGGSGTVTSIAQGYGITATPNPITTTGTIIADTTNGTLLFSRYKGQTWNIIGDSYVTSNVFQPWLIRGLGIDTVNFGSSGATITGGLFAGGSRPIVDRIDAALASNPAGIVIEGGSNDWIAGAPLGTIASNDTLTYYGAWKYILQKCLAKGNIKIMPVTMMKRGTDSTQFTSQKTYVDAVYQLCNLYGIPVIDVFNGSGITYQNSATYSSDAIHPNTAAGMKKYGNFLVSQILSDNSVPHIAAAGSTGWLLTGNSGTDTSTNFLGTTDNKGVIFKSNNFRSGLIDPSANANTAFGYKALSGSIVTGSGTANTAFGTNALGVLRTGQRNTAVGNGALASDTTASNNTAVGYAALTLDTSGTQNTGVGASSLAANRTGSRNTAVGYTALNANTSAADNTAVGSNALILNSTGIQNTAVGSSTLSVVSTGQQNTVIGYGSGSGTTGSFNTAVGRTSLFGNSSGTNNTAIGQSTGFTTSTGSSNVYVGNEAGYYNTASNQLHIASVKERSLINGDFSTQAVNFSPLVMTTVGVAGSGSGGTLAAGQYYYVVVARDVTTGESFKSNEVGYTATGTTSSVALTWTAVAGATDYKIYRGTVSGTYTVYFTSATNSFTDIGGASTGGSPVNGTTAYNFRFTSTGAFKVPSFITTAGTTGAVTINKMSGTVNLAAAGTSVVVTNSLVTTSSIVFAVIRTNDANGTSIKSVVPAAGSFTININTAPAAEISIGWMVIN